MKSLRRHTLLLGTALLVACGGPAVTIATRPNPQNGPGRGATLQPARLWVQQGSESNGHATTVKGGRPVRDPCAASPRITQLNFRIVFR